MRLHPLRIFHFSKWLFSQVVRARLGVPSVLTHADNGVRGAPALSYSSTNAATKIKQQ